MSRLRITREVRLTVRVETDLVAWMNSWGDSAIRDYLERFDDPPGWWMDEHKYEIVEDVPDWQWPMVAIALLNVDARVEGAQHSASARLRFDWEVYGEVPLVSQRSLDAVVPSPLVDKARWTEDDFRALCMAVTWLGQSEHSVLTPEELGRIPGPLDDPLV